MQAGSLF